MLAGPMTFLSKASSATRNKGCTKKACVIDTQNMLESILCWACFSLGSVVLWNFVDDATCFFTRPVQYSRLMPRLIAKVAYMGLSLSVKKTCALGLVSPRALTCLPDVAHMLEAKFVGVKLVFSDSDAHQISDLLRRALVAYVTNKTLLAHPEVPRGKRLQMFTVLGTSALLSSRAG